jgi:hypothetical protein
MFVITKKNGSAAFFFKKDLFGVFVKKHNAFTQKQKVQLGFPFFLFEKRKEKSLCS